MGLDRFLDPCDWSFPVPIKYGPGRLAEVGEICRKQGLQRPLIVTDRSSRDLPFIMQVFDFLKAADMSPAIFSDVSPNPTDDEVVAGKLAFKTGRHDSVIAIGGGSGMDAGKAISLIAQVDRNLWDFDFDNDVVEGLTANSFPPLLCIPSTAGTGAETESTAMVTDTTRKIKGCVWHPAQRLFAVILDPEITLTLPTNLTAWTGCDALVHVIEAYCVKDWHPMCDGIALEGLGLIYRWLPEVLDNPQSVSARGAMLVGSCLAGVSFLKGLGLVHAISHMIGAEYDTQHGLTNAVILPVVLRFNQSAIEQNIRPMCQAMQLSGDDFDTFYSAVVEFLDRCSIPRSLQELGVEPSRVKTIAAKAYQDAAAATNPISASVEDIEAIIEKAIRQAR